MRRTVRLPLLIVLAGALLVIATSRLQAVGPSALTFYGGHLQAPLVVYPGNPSFTPTSFLWDTNNGGVSWAGVRGVLPSGLEGRRYVNLAIYWGRLDNQDVLKPDGAAQHGRVYLPTATEPAVIVMTQVRMVAADLKSPPAGVRAPESLDGFIAGWALTPEQTEQLKQMAAALF